MKTHRTLWKLLAISTGIVLGVGGGMAVASRNSAGTYSLPAGNPVVTGQAISSAWANATLGDISTELTDSLSRTGKGGMVAPFRVTDGTVAAPSLSFTSETGTGLYRIGAAHPALSVTGTKVQEWTATGTTVTGTAVVSGAVTHQSTTALQGATTQSVGDYLMTLAGAQAVTKSGGTLTVGTGDANALYLKTGGTNQWSVDTSGNLAPVSTTQTITANGVTVPNGGIALTQAADQTLHSTRGMFIQTDGAYDLHLGVNGAQKWYIDNATGNLNSFSGTGKVTNLATPTVASDAATKGYVDTSVDVRAFQGSNQACSAAGNGTALFAASYTTAPVVHWQGVLYVNGSANGTFSIACLPSTAQDLTYLYVDGAWSTATVYAPTQVANNSTTGATITITQVNSSGVYFFHGAMRSTSATAGTLTCYCKSGTMTATLLKGSNWAYNVDN